MNFWEKVKNFTRPYEDEDYEDDYEDEAEETFEEEQPKANARTRRSPFASSDFSDDYSTSENTSAGANNSTFTGSSTTGSSFTGHVHSTGSKQEVVLFHAKSFDDAGKAATELCNRKAIILNMENVDKALTRRVVDFLSGTVYALSGSVKKVAQSTYLFCPHNMHVVGEMEGSAAEAETYI